MEFTTQIVKWHSKFENMMKVRWNSELVVKNTWHILLRWHTVYLCASRS